MSLFPDIWWQSPPSSGKDRDVRGQYHHRNNNLCNNHKNGIITTNGEGDEDIMTQSHNYGSIRHNENENNDLENNTNQRAVSPIIYEEQTLLPIVYSPSSVDNNNNDNVQSEISSASCINGNEHDDDDDDDSIEIIEQPHRTMGLIFFDFIRCIAISANVRCLNTQLMPIFMALGSGAGIGNGMGGNSKMKNNANQLDALSVALRLFISLFSILLILVEFPDVFPCLQHAPRSYQQPTATTIPTATTNHPRSSTSSIASSSSAIAPLLLPSQSSSSSPPPPPPPPPLYITNWIPRGIFYIFLSTITLEQSLVVRAFDNERHVNSYSRFFDGFFIVVSAYIMAATGVMYVLLGMCCCQRIMERVRRDEKEKWRVYYEKVMEMELQEEEEDDEEENEEEERRKLLFASSSSLEWVNAEKTATNGRRRVRLIDEEDEEQEEEIHTALGWIQWYCFGRCCWQRWLRWWRRKSWEQRKNRRRRRRRQQHQTKGCGFCQQFGCRTVDWRL